LFTVSLLIFLVGGDGYGQFKGGFGGGATPAGGTAPVRKAFNLAGAFDFMAKGNAYITIADMRPGRMKDAVEEFAKEKGIVNGQVTRDQWTQYSEWYKAKQATGGLGGTPVTAVAEVGSPGGPPPGATVEMLRLWADTEFKRIDENGDGKLNPDEMPPALRKERVVWDKNNDGLIDQEEYRAYFIARFQERNAGSAAANQKNPNAGQEPDDDLDQRPVVYRAGKLPAKGLPTWFKQLDADNDGQVALYEWRQAGKNLEEFTFWDRDDDGFITPEEALHVNAALLKTEDPLLASAESTPGSMGQGGFGNGKGGFGNAGFGNGKGFGKGGFGNGKGFGNGRNPFGGFGGNPTGGQFPGFGNRGAGGRGFGGGGGQMGTPQGGQFGRKGGGRKGGGFTPPDGN
jgi:hypothetical protein